MDFRGLKFKGIWRQKQKELAMVSHSTAEGSQSMLCGFLIVDT